MVQVAILVDDMIDTGRTLAIAAKSLKEHGAQSVYAVISHGSYSVTPFLSVQSLTLPVSCSGLLSELKLSMIEELPIEQLVVRRSVL